MRLDLLVPTLNRALFLERTLRSLLEARVPDGLEVVITVVENHCTDGTVALLERVEAENPGRIRHVSERRRGKSRALNAGIAQTRGELVGMVDDDEEVDPHWYEVIHDAFIDESLDFIGGPYVPRWAAEPPSWLPLEYLAVVGAADNGGEPREFSEDFPGILKGGNAVIRRRVLERVGPYVEWLGPSGDARLLSCEDEEMYRRLLKAGARGKYEPSLVIYHHVFEERLTKSYYRRWCFWRGVSRGLMDRLHPLPVPYLAGVPRYLYGRAGRGVVSLTQRVVRGGGWNGAFVDELSVWDLAGYFHGKHTYPLARFIPHASRRK
jgi:glycosyltransferase involved in cell wall biosynthesis